MKKLLIITLLLLQSLILYSQTEFISPDREKRVVINKIEEKKYQVIVNSTPHKSYREIVNQKIYFVTDSCNVAYIAKCDDGYCIVVDGVEQPHYKEIFQNKITISPDKKNWAYSALYHGEWIYVSAESNLNTHGLDATEIKKTESESNDMKGGIIVGFNRKHFGGFKIKTDNIIGDANIGSAMGYEGYIGYGGFDSEGGGAIELGYSKYRTPVTLNNISKEFSVKAFYWDIKVYLPAKWKLQSFLYFGTAWASLNIDLGEVHQYYVQKGNTRYLYRYVADSEYWITLYNIGYGYKFYFLPNICFQGSLSLSFLMGDAHKFSYSMRGGGLPEKFNTFNEYYDFGFEIIF